MALQPIGWQPGDFLVEADGGFSAAHSQSLLQDQDDPLVSHDNGTYETVKMAAASENMLWGRRDSPLLDLAAPSPWITNMIDAIRLADAVPDEPDPTSQDADVPLPRGADAPAGVKSAAVPSRTKTPPVLLADEDPADLASTSDDLGEPIDLNASSSSSKEPIDLGTSSSEPEPIHVRASAARFAAFPRRGTEDPPVQTVHADAAPISMLPARPSTPERATRAAAEAAIKWKMVQHHAQAAEIRARNQAVAARDQAEVALEQAKRARAKLKLARAKQARALKAHALKKLPKSPAPRLGPRQEEALEYKQTIAHERATLDRLMHMRAADAMLRRIESDNREDLADEPERPRKRAKHSMLDAPQDLARVPVDDSYAFYARVMRALGQEDNLNMPPRTLRTTTKGVTATQGVSATHGTSATQGLTATQ